MSCLSSSCRPSSPLSSDVIVARRWLWQRSSLSGLRHSLWCCADVPFTGLSALEPNIHRCWMFGCLWGCAFHTPSWCDGQRMVTTSKRAFTYCRRCRRCRQTMLRCSALDVSSVFQMAMSGSSILMLTSDVLTVSMHSRCLLTDYCGTHGSEDIIYDDAEVDNDVCVTDGDVELCCLDVLVGCLGCIQ